MKSGKRFQIDFKKYGMIIALVAITIFFQYLTNGVLLAPMNISKLIMQNGYILILAIGMLPIILTGDIDLSVGSVMALVGAVTSILLVGNTGFPVWLAVVIGLLLGVVIGAWQGFWIAYVKVPAFIATLAGMLFFRGITLVVTNGKTIGPFPNSYQYIAQAYIPDIGNMGIQLTTILIGVVFAIWYVFSEVKKRRKEISYSFEVSSAKIYYSKITILAFIILFSTYWLTRFKGAPVILIILGILTLFYAFVTQRTVIGRHI